MRLESVTAHSPHWPPVVAGSSPAFDRLAAACSCCAVEPPLASAGVAAVVVAAVEEKFPAHSTCSLTWGSVVAVNSVLGCSATVTINLGISTTVYCILQNNQSVLRLGLGVRG